jgi:hypothetical protein
MRGCVSHGPMPATVRSASLRCHRSRDTRPDRFLADHAEAVFVLVGFRRFAQFSENQRQRADTSDEKACDYEHDLNQARFAPLSVVSTLSYHKRFCIFQSGNPYQWGWAAQTNAQSMNFFPQTVPCRVLSAQSVKRFCVFQSGNRTSGECPVQTNARDRRISFRRLCFTEFYQHNPSDFCTVLFRR